MSTFIDYDNSDGVLSTNYSEEFDKELDEMFKNAPAPPPLQVISKQFTDKTTLPRVIVLENEGEDQGRTGIRMRGNSNLSERMRTTNPSSSRISRKRSSSSSIIRTHDDDISRCDCSKEEQQAATPPSPHQRGQLLIENTIFVGNVPQLVMSKVSVYVHWL
jgi:hypothetical protein